MLHLQLRVPKWPRKTRLKIAVPTEGAIAAQRSLARHVKNKWIKCSSEKNNSSWNVKQILWSASDSQMHNNLSDAFHLQLFITCLALPPIKRARRQKAPISVEKRSWCFQKRWYPKSSILIGFSIIFTIPFLGYLHFWKHPSGDLALYGLSSDDLSWWVPWPVGVGWDWGTRVRLDRDSTAGSFMGIISQTIIRIPIKQPGFNGKYTPED